MDLPLQPRRDQMNVHCSLKKKEIDLAKYVINNNALCSISLSIHAAEKGDREREREREMG